MLEFDYPVSVTVPDTPEVNPDKRFSDIRLNIKYGGSCVPYAFTQKSTVVIDNLADIIHVTDSLSASTLRGRCLV